MRDLRRNQTPFWYSLYLGKEPVLKDGHKTGQYREEYSEPVRAMARITSCTGESEVEMFGSAVSYDRLISTVQKLPLDEYSRVWIDADPSTGAPHNYKVTRTAYGLNNHLWAVQKVVRDGG